MMTTVTSRATRGIVSCAAAVAVVSSALVGASVSSAAAVPAVRPAGVIVRAGIPPYPGVLTIGSHGAAVVAVQRGLLRRGYRIPSLNAHTTPYGSYGPETAAAVLLFKKRHPQLGTVNGMVGPRTYAALTGYRGTTTTPSPAPATPAPSASGGLKALRARAPYAWNTPEYAKWYAYNRMHAYGWPVAQMTACLRPMWIGESHWQYGEITGQYVGIPQTTIGVANDYGFTESAYRNTPEVQVEVGLKYIRDRYSTPCAAWKFWKAQGAWQDSQDPTQWWGGWY